jgi:predicted phosphodiesterase
MRVGLISDVHANAPALRAVLDAMPDVERIVHAGDVVGYNPYPNETINLFREYDIFSIAGNHDLGVLGESEFDFSPFHRDVLGWTRERLTDDNLDYLAGLSTEALMFDNRLYVAHGSPGDTNGYVYPDDVSETLLSGEDVLVLGHTHYPAIGRFDDGLVLNPGSVGQPRDGDLRAAFAVLDMESLAVDRRRTWYPMGRVLDRIGEVGLPEGVGERLTREDR